MQVSWIDTERLRQLVAQITPEQERVCEPVHEPAANLPVTMNVGSGLASDWLEPVGSLAEFSERFTLVPQPPTMLPDTRPAKEVDAPDPVDGAHVMPLSRIRDKLRAIRQRASDAGILTRGVDPVQTEASRPLSPTTSAHSRPDTERRLTPAGAGQSRSGVTVALPNRFFPPFEIPQGPRDQRLAAFAGWARQLLDDSGSHVLVMSGEGEVLWGGSAKAGLVLSAMMAWGSAMHASTLPPGGVPGVVCAPLSSGHVLTVVPCETVGGVLHAAIVASKAVPEATASLLQGALAAAIS